MERSSSSRDLGNTRAGVFKVSLVTVARNRNEGTVKKMALLVLVLFSTFVWAGPNPDPADYSVNVNVSTSRMVIEGTPSPTSKG